MTEQRDSSPDARVLRRLVHELSAEGAPDLDWDRTESKLFAALDATTPHAPSGRKSLEAQRPRVEESDEAVIASEGSRLSVGPSLGAETPARVHALGTWRRVGLGLVAVMAVAAAVMFSVTRTTPTTAPPVATKDVVVDPTQLPEAPGMSGYRQLSALKSGDIVEAEVGAIAFGEQGGVEWTLAAGSRLVVRTAFAAGVSEHVVELDSGSVRGRVHARSDVRFVVTAGETQVVSFSEGAIFTVTRSSKRVVVHMEHGTATVGQKGEQGQQIEAPVFAALGLDGVSGFELLQDETVARSTTPSRAAVFDETQIDRAQVEEVRVDGGQARDAQTPPARRDLVPAARNPEPPPAAPTAVTVDPPAVVNTRVMLSSVTPGLFACMNGVRAKQRAESSADPGLLVTVTSTLKVNIDADGKVKGVTFSPPLAPSLQNCAVALFGVTLDSGERTEMVPIQLK